MFCGFMLGLMTSYSSNYLILVLCAIPLFFGIHGIYMAQADLEGFYDSIQAKKFLFHGKLGLLLSLIGILVLVLLNYR
jgi:fumarate reductase subunit D